LGGRKRRRKSEEIFSLFSVFLFWNRWWSRLRAMAFVAAAAAAFSCSSRSCKDL
jgi:hypothetical protein